MKNETQTDTESIESKILAVKADKDALKISKLLDRDQAACLVKDFYIMQENRMRYSQQHKALEKRSGGAVLSTVADYAREQEDRVAKMLIYWSKEQRMAIWAMQNVGIGPIIAAGLVAHINVTMSPHLSSLWAFAGMPGDCEEKKWVKGKKRPFNAALKKLCFKVGESFVKNQNREGCYYGQLFAKRKALEWERNLNGDFAAQAQRQLKIKDWSKASTAKLFYEGKMSPTAVRKMLKSDGVPEGVKATHVGDEVPMLPPAHIHARARRYAVKRFLAHYWIEAYKQHFRTEPPKAYVFEKLGHAHEDPSPVPSMAKLKVTKTAKSTAQVRAIERV